jgi:hypothetical protein
MGRLFDWGSAAPGRDFDCRPFAFRHALGNEPLFGAVRLAELEARAASGPLVLDRQGDDGAFLARCEAELREAIPALGPREAALTATLVRRAPGSGVGFEIDPASDFILGLAGAATVRIFDPATGIPSAYDLERFYQRGDSSVCQSLERRAAEASVFGLAPGSAVHRPRHAPFAGDAGGSGAALELHLTVLTRAARREMAAHRVNGFLRMVGVNARPVGQSVGTDRIKEAAASVDRFLWPFIERVSGVHRD